MHIDHTRRHSIMIRTVALIALVGSASAAAADYSSAEIGCTNAYNMVTCSSAVTESSCTNALCLWVDDEEDCKLAAGDDTATAWDADGEAENDALQSAETVCENSASAEDDCTGDCAWWTEDEMCTLSVTKAEKLLDDDGANGGTTAARMNSLFDEITCRHLDATAAACDAVDGCAVMNVRMDYGLSGLGCTMSVAKELEVIEAKCGTNGAAALATAEAAAGISAAKCAVNEYVKSKVCTACAAGSTNALGDDASGADTTCDATKCAVNEYVKSKVCTACAAGSTNTVGDDASGVDTECDVDAAVKASSASRSDVSFATIAMVIATLLACATV